MMSRNLEKKDLAEFTQWVEDKDYPVRPGQEQYQALQVYIGGTWYSVNEKLFAPKHLSVSGNKLERLVHKFYDERKADG